MWYNADTVKKGAINMITNIILTITICWTFFWTLVNFVCVLTKNDLPALNNIFMSVGWTIIIAHIIGIW